MIYGTRVNVNHSAELSRIAIAIRDGMIKGLIVFLILSFSPQDLLAEDRIVLKDGTVLHGTIGAQSADGTMLYLGQGEDEGEWIQISQIERISYAPRNNGDVT